MKKILILTCIFTCFIANFSYAEALLNQSEIQETCRNNKHCISALSKFPSAYQIDKLLNLCGSYKDNPSQCFYYSSEYDNFDELIIAIKSCNGTSGCLGLYKNKNFRESIDEIINLCKNAGTDHSNCLEEATKIQDKSHRNELVKLCKGNGECVKQALRIDQYSEQIDVIKLCDNTGYDVSHSCIHFAANISSHEERKKLIKICNANDGCMRALDGYPPKHNVKPEDIIKLCDKKAGCIEAAHKFITIRDDTNINVELINGILNTCGIREALIQENPICYKSTNKISSNDILLKIILACNKNKSCLLAATDAFNNFGDHNKIIKKIDLCKQDSACLYNSTTNENSK